ncbi:hypothetical protein DM01DRAFT_1381392 [Hesseltinella vesiculosa]|uniref:Sphingomyelin phosphodiesterase n=1 Tax=Hesseltinella vesiculosa TaxID=101127 RepID=A0A1X2GR03_9FUNG|nr:hypothetical protein DM01DRAFT_1381392 [Hesseltinella vesiculosa]
MEKHQAFKSKDVTTICTHVLQYCDEFINFAPDILPDASSSLHTFLPSLLTCIFGAPKTRGWIQTELTNEQDRAIQHLLQPKSAFIAALIKLSTQSDFCYDVLTDKLPDDIRRALTTGSVQYLPRIYNECIYLDKSKVINSIDYRAAATRQASVFPMAGTGEYRVRFNMIQFFLYYMTTAPTWPPLLPPSPTPASATSSINPFARSALPFTSSSTTTPSATATSTTASTTSQPPTNTVESTFLLPGKIRPIREGVYLQLIQQYMATFIPYVINEAEACVPGIEFFFQDALMEIWVRSLWIPSGQKLSLDMVTCLFMFVKYVITGDLRRAVISNADSLFGRLYQQLKVDYYLLLSRCALNWQREDSYIWLLNLWTLWSSPWKYTSTEILQGAPKNRDEWSRFKSKARVDHSPLDEGWALFLLDNACYYVTLVDVFLQRLSTSTLPDRLLPSPTPAPTNPTLATATAMPSGNANGLQPTSLTTPLSASKPIYPPVIPVIPAASTAMRPGPAAQPHPVQPAAPLQGTSLYGELVLINQLLDLWQTQGMVPLLRLVEDGIEATEAETSTLIDTHTYLANFLRHTRDQIIAHTPLAPPSHLAKVSDALTDMTSLGDRALVRDKLKQQHQWIRAVQGGTQVPWKASRLYSASRNPRQETLTKTLDTLSLAVKRRQPPPPSTLKKIGAPWTPFGQPTASTTTESQKQDAESISEILVSLSTTLEVPVPDSSAIESATTSTPINHTKPSLSTATASASTLQAPSFTTATRRKTVKDIIPLGPRPDTIVHSYESAFLLKNTYRLDCAVKHIWRRWIYHYCNSAGPDPRVSFRFLATPANVIYIILLVILIFHLVF